MIHSKSLKKYQTHNKKNTHFLVWHGLDLFPHFGFFEMMPTTETSSSNWPSVSIFHHRNTWLISSRCKCWVVQIPLVIFQFLPPTWTINGFVFKGILSWKGRRLGFVCVITMVGNYTLKLQMQERMQIRFKAISRDDSMFDILFRVMDAHEATKKKWKLQVTLTSEWTIRSSNKLTHQLVQFKKAFLIPFPIII